MRQQWVTAALRGGLLGLLAVLPATACKKTGDSATEPAVATETKPTEPQQGEAHKAPAQAAPRPAVAARPRPEQLAGAHILIAYKGAMRASPKVTRSKEEAQKLALELAAKAKKSPETFAQLAKKHSDGPSGPRGGDLGSWTKGQMVPAFDEGIIKLKVGEVSDPIETPFGFHVIRRNELPPLYAGAHILIAYKGAMRANPKVTRSKAEAQKLAKELAQRAKKAPDTFAELAKENSDGPSAPRGGSLGKWPKGRMVPAFDEAIGKLKVGEISEPVETPFGFHVMKREDPDKVP